MYENTPSYHIAVVNDRATRSREADRQILAVHDALAGPDTGLQSNTDYPSPELWHDLSEESILVSSYGGDGTVQATLRSLAGIVPGDPEQTAKNLATHQELAPFVTYFAIAGGNANNWPLSAHRRYARHPERIDRQRLFPATHRPLYWEVFDDNGEIIMNDIATSCFGFMAAAIAAERLEVAKPSLRNRPRPERLARELAISTKAMLHAPSFSAELTLTESGDTSSWHLAGVTGLEFIGSRVYAKQGRTQVNVDDTRWQPLVVEHGPNACTHAANLAETLGRLAMGRSKRSPIDFTGLTMSVRITSDGPVPFHADGEVQRLLPGQTFRARPAKIVIPTLIAR